MTTNEQNTVDEIKEEVAFLTACVKAGMESKDMDDEVKERIMRYYRLVKQNEYILCSLTIQFSN